MQLIGQGNVALVSFFAGPVVSVLPGTSDTRRSERSECDARTPRIPDQRTWRKRRGSGGAEIRRCWNRQRFRGRSPVARSPGKWCFQRSRSAEQGFCRSPEVRPSHRWRKRRVRPRWYSSRDEGAGASHQVAAPKADRAGQRCQHSSPRKMPSHRDRSSRNRSGPIRAHR
jgi:hypothetical protein